MQLYPAGRTTRPDPHAPLTLGELRRYVPSQPHRTTIEKWCERGVDGVTLQHEWHGRRRFTCLKWYEEFSEAIGRKRQ
jgi:hypothetical protein